jgi:preprotein translocase subunit YajC
VATACAGRPGPGVSLWKEPELTVKSLVQLLPFVLIIGVFYLVALRPARNRQRAAAQLQNELGPGMQVMTGSGIYATVSKIEDDAVLLEVSPGVTMRFAKQAIARVIPADEPGADDEDPADRAASTAEEPGRRAD